MQPMPRVCAVLAAMCAGAEASMTPTNIHLADSPWPTAHGDSYATDNSRFPVPEDGDSLRVELEGYGAMGSGYNSLNPITIVSDSDGKLWATSISSVMVYQVAEGNNLELADIYYQGFDFKYHGAYSFVSAAGVYYSSSQQGFRAYKFVDGKIQPDGEFVAPDCADHESVIGVLMMYDGTIAFATSAARVGIVRIGAGSLDLVEMIDVRREGEDPVSFISNSFSVDENGGIYLVSASSLYRVQWNNQTERVTEAWRSVYSDGDPLHPGRLGKGVGSTPSIMTQPNGDQHLVVSDGRMPMNVLAIDTQTGTITGNATVDFGIEGELSQSEQSTVVSDQRVVVVQNNFPPDRVSSICGIISLTVGGKLATACPYMMGTWPYHGVQQFRVNAQGEVEATWRNSNVQCSSSIPAVAPQGSGKTLLCVGQRERDYWSLFGWFLPGYMYTLESLDWETGELVWTKGLGAGAWFNPMYAGVQVGDKSDMMFGTVGGVVRVSPGDSDDLALCWKGPLQMMLCNNNIQAGIWMHLIPLVLLIVALVIGCRRCKSRAGEAAAGTELAAPLEN